MSSIPWRFARRQDWKGQARFDLCMFVVILVEHVEGNDATEDILLDEMRVFRARLVQKMQYFVVLVDLEAVEFVAVEYVMHHGLEFFGQLLHH